MWNKFKVYYKDTRTKSVNIGCLWTYFRPFSTVCIVYFEQVKVCWSIFPVPRYVNALITFELIPPSPFYIYRHPSISVGIYLLKINNRNTRARYEICSKLTINTPERHQEQRSGVFIVNFEYISHLALVFLLITWNMYLPTGIGEVGKFALVGFSSSPASRDH